MAWVSVRRATDEDIERYNRTRQLFLRKYARTAKRSAELDKRDPVGWKREVARRNAEYQTVMHGALRHPKADRIVDKHVGYNDGDN